MVRRSLLAVALEVKCCWELDDVRCAEVEYSMIVAVEL